MQLRPEGRRRAKVQGDDADDESAADSWRHTGRARVASPCAPRGRRAPGTGAVWSAAVHAGRAAGRPRNDVEQAERNHGGGRADGSPRPVWAGARLGAVGRGSTRSECTADPVSACSWRSSRRRRGLLAAGRATRRKPVGRYGGRGCKRLRSTLLGWGAAATWRPSRLSRATGVPRCRRWGSSGWRAAALCTLRRSSPRDSTSRAATGSHALRPVCARRTAREFVRRSAQSAGRLRCVWPAARPPTRRYGGVRSTGSDGLAASEHPARGRDVALAVARIRDRGRGHRQRDLVDARESHSRARRRAARLGRRNLDSHESPQESKRSLRARPQTCCAPRIVRLRR